MNMVPHKSPSRSLNRQAQNVRYLPRIIHQKYFTSEVRWMLVCAYIGENSSLNDRIERRFSPHLMHEFTVLLGFVLPL
jgi:hypothetical protein